MRTNILILLSILLFASCASTKVELKKVNFADTNITFGEYNFNNFNSAFRTFYPNEAFNFAETESQKIAAKALEHVTKNKYDEAADLFSKAMLENDSLENLWSYFPKAYYFNINYDLEKLENYENIRKGITDSSFVFYKDKPKFDIEFVEDSLVIPIKLNNGLPIVKIKINGKYYFFVVDTGTDRTLIGKNIATKNNIALSNKENKIRAIDGYALSHSAILPELDLGQIKISHFPIEVINRNDVIKTKFLFITFFKCDGVIGWDLLCKFDFTIDYKNEQFILRKPVKKNIKQRNLFWYKVPIVKFYSSNNYPLLFFFDSGSNVSYFNNHLISTILGIDMNDLKKGSREVHGLANESIKIRYYKYPDFQCYTIANDEISFLSANKILLQDTWKEISPINIDGNLGSDWFKDKAIRVDILNGIFEIYE